MYMIGNMLAHSKNILSLNNVRSKGGLSVSFELTEFPSTVWRHIGQVTGKLNSCMDECFQLLTATYPWGFFAFKPHHSWINSSPPMTQMEQTSAE